jgi:uncharacterized protein (TIGR00290 family)
MKDKVIFSWSGGKDSAYALYQLQKNSAYEINSLFTTFSEYNRVGFHGVSKELMQQQADLIGINLISPVIETCENIEEYALKLEKHLELFPKSNISTIAYGDIFLEDLREYRLKTLDKLGIKAVFPIWKQDTKAIINDFIDIGFKAITTCVDSKVLDKSFVGRTIDKDFINDLPKNVDPCGENGEFHTFVFDGPILNSPVNFFKGDISLRNGFYYCDLIKE